MYNRDGNRRITPAQKEQDLENVDPKLQSEALAEAKLAPEHMKVTGAVTPANVGFMGKVKKGLLHGVTYDIHAIVEEDNTLKELHGHAEVFEPRIEMSFSYLQVLP